MLWSYLSSSAQDFLRLQCGRAETSPAHAGRQQIDRVRRNVPNRVLNVSSDIIEHIKGDVLDLDEAGQLVRSRGGRIGILVLLTLDAMTSHHVTP